MGLKVEIKITNIDRLREHIQKGLILSQGLKEEIDKINNFTPEILSSIKED